MEEGDWFHPARGWNLPPLYPSSPEERIFRVRDRSMRLCFSIRVGCVGCGRRVGCGTPPTLRAFRQRSGVWES